MTLSRHWGQRSRLRKKSRVDLIKWGSRCQLFKLSRLIIIGIIIQLIRCRGSSIRNLKRSTSSGHSWILSSKQLLTEYRGQLSDRFRRITRRLKLRPTRSLHLSKTPMLGLKFRTSWVVMNSISRIWKYKSKRRSRRWNRLKIKREKWVSRLRSWGSLMMSQRRTTSTRFLKRMQRFPCI